MAMMMHSAFDKAMDGFRALDRSLGAGRSLDLDPVALRVITDLFMLRQDYTSEEVARFEAMAGRLVDRTDRAVVAHVAARIAHHPQAPLALLNRFVAMGGAIALPVLEAASLDDRMLLEMAAEGLPELAAAVARRIDLDAATCELLAERRDRRVNLALAANAAAPLEAHAIALLVEAARCDAELARLVLARVAARDHPSLFLHADMKEREAMLLAARRADLGRSPAMLDAAPAPLRARIGAAGLAGDRAALAICLAGALGMDLPLSRAMVEDEGGEPLALALTAIGLLPEEAAPVFLFAHPAVGHSVEKVRRLVGIIRHLPAPSARRMIAAMAGLERQTPRHMEREAPRHMEGEAPRHMEREAPRRMEGTGSGERRREAGTLLQRGGTEPAQRLSQPGVEPDRRRA